MYSCYKGQMVNSNNTFISLLWYSMLSLPRLKHSIGRNSVWYTIYIPEQAMYSGSSLTLRSASVLWTAVWGRGVTMGTMSTVWVYTSSHYVVDVVYRNTKNNTVVCGVITLNGMIWKTFDYLWPGWGNNWVVLTKLASMQNSLQCVTHSLLF